MGHIWYVIMSLQICPTGTLACPCHERRNPFPSQPYRRTDGVRYIGTRTKAIQQQDAVLLIYSKGQATIDHSPDGRHIIFSSHDKTIRIRDAETGSTIGKPLGGHTQGVCSWSATRGTHFQALCIGYFPDGRHIISGSSDETIQMWDARTGSAVDQPPDGYAHWKQFVANSPTCWKASLFSNR